MIRSFGMLAIAVAAGLAGADVSPAQTAPDAPRVVIEMFTSQGCSSCPPADALLGELAKRRDVVAISLPVDYWDYLGWKDTLADKSFSDRQKLYGKSRGDRQVYTPQAVINGAAHAVGSDRIAIDSAIRVAQPLSVPVKLTRRDGGLRVEIGAAAGSARGGGVWLVPQLAWREVAIGRGENRGRSVGYVNVARPLIKLGDWNGEARGFDVSAEQLRASGAERIAVLVQAGQDRVPGGIIGAASLELK